jgi:hypothetical protein
VTGEPVQTRPAIFPTTTASNRDVRTPRIRFPWGGELALTGRYSSLDLQLPILDLAHRPRSERHELARDRTLQTGLHAEDLRLVDHHRQRGTVVPTLDSSRTHRLRSSAIRREARSTPRAAGRRVEHVHDPKWNTLTLGWEYRSESGPAARKARSRVRSPRRSTHCAFFGQDELTLFDRLVLGGGSGGRTTTSSIPL